MDDILFEPGDEITALVTALKPFGVFVEADGVPGLIRGAQVAVGATVRAVVVEFDPVARRFSATMS